MMRMGHWVSTPDWMTGVSWRARRGQMWWGQLRCTPPSHASCRCPRPGPGSSWCCWCSRWWQEEQVCEPGQWLGRMPSPSCETPENKKCISEKYFLLVTTNPGVMRYQLPAHPRWQIEHCLPPSLCWRKTCHPPGLEENKIIIYSQQWLSHSSCPVRMMMSKLCGSTQCFKSASSLDNQLS